MDLIIAFGGEVKAEGDGKFRAPLVSFGSPTAADLSGEFFTAKCDFWRDFPSEAPLLYHHGLDAKLGLMKIGKNNRAKLSRDDAAVWMQGQLDMADEYQKRIYALIEAGKMGTSSGSSPHMVKKAKSGNAYEILSWPITEASLTPTPAEPRNRVTAIKSEADYKGLFERVDDDPMSGLGAEITASALSRMFDRVLNTCYSQMRNGVNKEAMHALLDSFSGTAKQFITAVCSMDEETDRAEAMTAKASPETIREAEQFLRDVWKCSRAEAKGLAPVILPLLLRDVGAEPPTEETPDAVKAARDAMRRELVRESLAFETLLGATI